jgi:cell division protein FtsB
MIYLSTAILILHGDLRKEAQRVALAAVAVAVLLNIVTAYAANVPGGLESGKVFAATFDWLNLILAAIESLPAVLAFSMSGLLHKLSEHDADIVQRDDDVLVLSEQQAAIEAQQNVLSEGLNDLRQAINNMSAEMKLLSDSSAGLNSAENQTQYTCDGCGMEMSRSQYGGHKNQSQRAELDGVYCTACRNERRNGSGKVHEVLEDMEVMA